MKKRIIIGVGIAGHPVSASGNTWAFLQWALGFRSLGWEVWLVEGLDGGKCVDEKSKPAPFEQSENRAHWHRIVKEFGFENHSSLFVDGVSERESTLKHFIKDTSVFLNLSGHFKRRELWADVPHRVYVDLDPAFTQIWANVYRSDMNFDGHNHFFSVGLKMGQSDIRVPDTGHHWRPTLPPVDLNFWNPKTEKNKLPVHVQDCWTTVTHWYGYPSVEWQGSSYTGKAEEFEKLLNLPQRTKRRILLGTDLDPTWSDYHKYYEKGWNFAKAADLCRDWRTYRSFLHQSHGEFCVAKGGYVTSRCGWFSDRSACYLALGRPVLLQNTGWVDVLGEQDGLLTFKDIPSAVAALEKVEQDYEKHCKAALHFAENHLNAKKVLTQFLTCIGVEP